MNNSPKISQIKEIGSNYPTIPLKYGVERRMNKFDQVPDELQRVSLDMIESWTGKVYNDNQEGEASTGLVEFHPGDVLFSKLRPYLAKGFRAQNRGAASPELLVLHPTEFTSRYLLYLLLSPDFVDRVDSSTYGAKMPRASWDFIGDIRVPKPPIEIQKEISRVLDLNIGHIDRITATCERSIKLLQERQNSYITSKVITGLNSNTEMTDSDVEWFDRLPSHWDRIRVKYLVQDIEQGWSPQCNDKPSHPEEWGVLKAGCVNGMSFDPNENKQLPDKLDAKPELAIEKGDVLISRANTRDLVGSCALVKEDPSKLLLCDKIYNLQLREDIVDPEYFVYAMNSDPSREQIELEATGASQSMVNISQEFINNMWVPLPPKSEQKGIAQIIAEENEYTRNIERDMKNTAELLRERRKALITKIVTGEIEIKNGKVNNREKIIT